MFEDSIIYYTPLVRVPIQHTCGHFELRLTRWYDPTDELRGFAQAGNECTVCCSERPQQPNYATLTEAQAEAETNPHVSLAGGRR
jgi:hypothetical protein